MLSINCKASEPPQSRGIHLAGAARLGTLGPAYRIMCIYVTLELKSLLLIHFTLFLSQSYINITDNPEITLQIVHSSCC